MTRHDPEAEQRRAETGGTKRGLAETTHTPVAPPYAPASSSHPSQRRRSPLEKVRLVNEQLRLERDRSDGASVRSSGSTDSTANSQMDKPITGSKPSPRLTRLAMGETSSSKTPKCNACGKTAYAAESVNVKEATYHKACFKCHECKTRLTLTTYQVWRGGSGGRGGGGE